MKVTQILQDILYGLQDVSSCNCNFLIFQFLCVGRVYIHSFVASFFILFKLVASYLYVRLTTKKLLLLLFYNNNKTGIYKNSFQSDCFLIHGRYYKKKRIKKNYLHGITLKMLENACEFFNSRIILFILFKFIKIENFFKCSKTIFYSYF